MTTDRTKRAWIPAVLVILFFVMLGGASLYLINLKTSKNTNVSSVSTDVFPKQDCCVPSTDLKGTWSFKNSSDSSFTAVISGKTIKIYMNSNNASMMYWYGTFDSYKPVGSVITSEVIYDDAVNILSKSTSKNFAVGETTLSFDFTAMGNTKKVDLSRV